jgi:predicted enzyme related to lactoylglutathione lyase
MEKVKGIGGFFFRAQDPKALAKWYEENLGIKRSPEEEGQEPWMQESGMTVFAPFAADTNYFGNTNKQWMLNLRVGNLDAMIAQLKNNGVDVGELQEFSYGRFARIHDPEGNPIELWED